MHEKRASGGQVFPVCCVASLPYMPTSPNIRPPNKVMWTYTSQLIQYSTSYHISQQLTSKSIQQYCPFLFDPFFQNLQKRSALSNPIGTLDSTPHMQCTYRKHHIYCIPQMKYKTQSYSAFSTYGGPVESSSEA